MQNKNIEFEFVLPGKNDRHGLMMPNSIVARAGLVYATAIDAEGEHLDNSTDTLASFMFGTSFEMFEFLPGWSDEEYDRGIDEAVAEIEEAAERGWLSRAVADELRAGWPPGTDYEHYLPEGQVDLEPEEEEEEDADGPR